MAAGGSKIRAVLELMAEEEEEEKAMIEEEEEEDKLLQCAIGEELNKKTSTERRWYVRPLNESRREDGEFYVLVQQMRAKDEERHFDYFRMSASRFDDLLRLVEPLIVHAPTHSTPVSPAERLAVTLRVLASGASHQMVAASYKLGYSTVCAIVTEVSQAIWLALKNEFVPFPSRAQFHEIALDFWRLWNYPNCIGAIDGKHVTLEAPPNAGSEFFNYKGQHSIVLMAVCDARYKFTMVDVGSFGRESDGGVFSQSAFGSALQDGTLDIPGLADFPGKTRPVPHVFVGDAAFPLHQNLMRPFPGRQLTEMQKVYNYRHSRARGRIENAFGILAARWRLLGRALECTPEKAGDIVHTCIALHNYLRCTDASNGPATRYIPDNFPDSTTASGDLQPGEWRRIVEGDTNLLPTGRLSHARASRSAHSTRDDFADYFQTPEGRVPWQQNAIQRGLLNV